MQTCCFKNTALLGLPWWLRVCLAVHWVQVLSLLRELCASLAAQTVKRLSNVGDLGSIPGLGRSPGKGNGNSLQYSYLRNPMDRWAWWTTVLGVAKELDTTEYTHTHGWVTNLYLFLQWNESVIRNPSFLDLPPTHQPYPSRSPQSTELSSWYSRYNLYSRFPLAVSNMAVHIRPSQSPNSSPPCPPVIWNTYKHLIFWSHCNWCHPY